MRFCSLGSGSRGNAHVVEKGETTLLIECGFGPRILQKKLLQRYLSPAEISAAFISHEHGDHTRGLALMEQHGIACYMSAGTAAALDNPPNWRCLRPGVAVTVGALSVTPVPVPHDVREPLQFVIDDGVRKLAIFTDLGHVTRVVHKACREADALMLECNYDDAMLQNGAYPQEVKERIAGAYGHLSNRDAARLVGETDAGRRRQVVAAHLSENNNDERLVAQALAAASQATVRIATQQDGTEWIEVGAAGRADSA